MHLEDLPDREHVVHTHESVVRRQQTFGYTEEELRIMLAPMATTGAEPLGSMGTDTPTAALSRRSRLLYDYFVQLFAQVTNPPLDSIREALVTCMERPIGAEQNLFHPGPASCRQIVMPDPVIDNDELAKLIHINDDGDMPGFAAKVISGLYEVDGGEAALREALDRVRREASEAIADGKRVLVLSDRDSDRRARPDPVAAVRLGGAPPPRRHPGADADRADRRVRRRPRGPPHGAAALLRGRGDQPLPRVRVDRGHDRLRAARARGRRRARSATTSGPPSRACSR